jgi:hypothetical protein
LGGRFHRLDPILPELYDIDDVKRMDLLKMVALDTDLAETLAWIDVNFKLEIDPLAELAG